MLDLVEIVRVEMIRLDADAVGVGDAGRTVEVLADEEDDGAGEEDDAGGGDGVSGGDGVTG
jgi:hypothetical protein